MKQTKETRTRLARIKKTLAIGVPLTTLAIGSGGCSRQTPPPLMGMPLPPEEKTPPSECKPETQLSDDVVKVITEKDPFGDKNQMEDTEEFVTMGEIEADFDEDILPSPAGNPGEKNSGDTVSDVIDPDSAADMKPSEPKEVFHTMGLFVAPEDLPKK